MESGGSPATERAGNMGGAASTALREEAAGEEVQRLPADCADMGDLTAVCSPPVRFPLVVPDQNAFATTFASRPPARKPIS